MSCAANSQWSDKFASPRGRASVQVRVQKQDHPVLLTGQTTSTLLSAALLCILYRHHPQEPEQPGRCPHRGIQAHRQHARHARGVNYVQSPRESSATFPTGQQHVPWHRWPEPGLCRQSILQSLPGVSVVGPVPATACAIRWRKTGQSRRGKRCIRRLEARFQALVLFLLPILAPERQ